MAEGMDEDNLDLFVVPGDIQVPTMENAFQVFLQQFLPSIVNRPDYWHPDHLQFGIGSYGPSCLARVLSDVRTLLSEEQPGADAFPSETDASRVDYLIRGQGDTPYEGGFFHFTVRIPPEYPNRPPRVAILTTGGGTVRFNPNFYENGCVCLSILGTWYGISWQPDHTLSNVLHSLQSRFNEMPWDNEPVFDRNMPREWKQLYSDFLTYQTLQVAVCDQLDPARSPLPLAMRQRAARYFVSNFERYKARCAELSQRLDGKPMMNPYQPSQRNLIFNFAMIGRRLEALLDGARRDAEAAVDSDDNQQ